MDLLPSQPREHETNHCKMNEGLARAGFAFVISVGKGVEKGSEMTFGMFFILSDRLARRWPQFARHRATLSKTINRVNSHPRPLSEKGVGDKALLD